MTVVAFFKVLFVALSLGLDVFAVSVGVGMKGTDRAVKIRIGQRHALKDAARAHEQLEARRTTGSTLLVP